MKKVFSIIIPVYNVAPYLRECLDSVLAQTFADWEAVCVDDGSTDDSGAILDEYATRDARFRIIHQANGGVSAARNIALGTAQGEWVLFLDGDDVYRVDTLEIIDNELKLHEDVDIVRFGAVMYDDGMSPLWERKKDICDLIDISNCVYTTALSGWFWQRAYNRDLVRDISFPLLRNGEDMVYLVRAVLRARSEMVLSDDLYGYRQRAGSASRGAGTSEFLVSILAYLKMIFAELEATEKWVDPQMIRLWCNVVTEFFIKELVKINGDERRQMFKAAQEAWNTIFSGRCIPLFQKLRYWLFRLFPFEIVAVLLFGGPYWLKIRGLHR